MIKAKKFASFVKDSQVKGMSIANNSVYKEVSLYDVQDLIDMAKEADVKVRFYKLKTNDVYPYLYKFEYEDVRFVCYTDKKVEDAENIIAEN